MTDAEILALERHLWLGDADVHRGLLAHECRMGLPGMGLIDRKAAIDGIAAGPRWDAVEFNESRVQRLGNDCLVLSYRSDALRGDARYQAVIVSVYALEDGDWKLTYHQQSPEPQGTER